jgi:small subunit ribosomal protein S16
MLAIRFNRVGKRNKSYFRVILQEHTVAPGGRHIAILGSYDPHAKKAVLESDKIKEWMEKGAQVSDSVYNLLIKEKVIEGKKRPIKVSRKKEKTQTGTDSSSRDKLATGQGSTQTKVEKKEEKKEEVVKKDKPGKVKAGEPEAEKVDKK